MGHLPHPLRPGETLESPVAEVDQRHGLGHLVPSEVSGRLGAEDLAAGGLVEEAGDPVERGAEERSGARLGGTDVDRHPHS